MAACETCWDTAYRMSQWNGRDQTDNYRELIKNSPSDGSHDNDAVRVERTSQREVIGERKTIEGLRALPKE